MKLTAVLAGPRQRFDSGVLRLAGALGLAVAKKRSRFEVLAGRHRPEALLAVLARRGDRLAGFGRDLDSRWDRRAERVRGMLDKWASRLAPSLGRMIGEAGRVIARDQARLDGLAMRLEAAVPKRLGDMAARLEALDRTRVTLGYAQTLQRGYAVVWGDGAVVTHKAAAEKAAVLEVEFHDGRVVLGPKSPRRGKAGGEPGQGSLF